MTTHYLLDTNIASHVIKGDIPQVRAQLVRQPMHVISISVSTQAELLYGVAKRGHPAGLAARVREFLARVNVLAWTAEISEVYGDLRAACEHAGVSLGAMDMMIAAQAKSQQEEAERHGDLSVLVTRDKAFTRIPSSAGLNVADWTVDPT